MCSIGQILKTHLETTNICVLFSDGLEYIVMVLSNILDKIQVSLIWNYTPSKI